MYQIKRDGAVIFDLREDDLIVENPKVTLAVNTVGSCSFTIHRNHPYYGRLQKMKSTFEVSDNIGVIFRGRMTNDSTDFNNSMDIDIEGAMAYFNDSVVRPYAFPEDFLTNADYITATESGNVVEFYLGWLINQHNEQTAPSQHFKLGRVTVSDPNNYITRADSTYPSTWEVLKSKLFDSELGGYLCIRYEEDGNYIDYLADFELTNTQEIVFEENLLDLKSESDSSETYSAIIPIGADIETETTDDEGNTTATKYKLTIESVEDGDITDDIVKKGDMIYSRSAVESCGGYIFAPVRETTWNDITSTSFLLNKAVNYLATDGMMLSGSVDVTAVDLHFTDEQIQSFRIYRNVTVRSIPHGHSGTYPLSKLTIDLLKPQNTKITVGEKKRTLTDINSEKESDSINRIETAEKDIAESRTDVTEVRNQLLTKSTQIMNDCEKIIMGALESYVETSNYTEFKETTESQLKLLTDELTLKFTETIEKIDNINGDLQQRISTITKYFTFDINGLTIGQVENPNKVVIDNDEISILVNGVVVQKFDSDGNALIPELSITRMLNLLGLVVDQDENNINCGYMGV